MVSSNIYERAQPHLGFLCNSSHISENFLLASDLYDASRTRVGKGFLLQTLRVRFATFKIGNKIQYE